MSLLIPLYSIENFYCMNQAGQLARKTLDMIQEYIRPGVTTAYLNDLCHNFIVENNAIPAPLNYQGFPKSVCTSVNSVACHGIPNDQVILKDGDIINIDVTVILNGWYGDTSRTFPVGAISTDAKKLIDTAYTAMWEGIKFVKEGVFLGDLGRVVESTVKSQGFSVVREFCGHGIGQVFHGEPIIHFFDDGTKGLKLKKGMMFTVEPIINQGRRYVEILNDHWTVVTKDNKLSAQFEHTIGILEDRCVVFTISTEEAKLFPQYVL